MDENIACDGPIITIGSKSNSHYQSLLTTEMFHLEDTRNRHQPSNVLNLKFNVSNDYVKENPPEKKSKASQHPKPNDVKTPVETQENKPKPMTGESELKPTMHVPRVPSSETHRNTNDNVANIDKMNPPPPEATVNNEITPPPFISEEEGKILVS